MKILHIAIALVWRDGRVLVSQRPDDAAHLPGVWEFPGGKCEDGESPQECARREVCEEVGIDVTITSGHPTITHEYSERRVTLYPFDCVIISGEPQTLQCAALRWLAPHELNAEEFPPANTDLIESLRTRQAQ